MVSSDLLVRRSLGSDAGLDEAMTPHGLALGRSQVHRRLNVARKPALAHEVGRRVILMAEAEVVAHLVGEAASGLIDAVRYFHDGSAHFVRIVLVAGAVDSGEPDRVLVRVGARVITDDEDIE